jgi:argonaute-like protein implicated in RNA metabolism and viral defense
VLLFDLKKKIAMKNQKKIVLVKFPQSQIVLVAKAKEANDVLSPSLLLSQLQEIAKANPTWFAIISEKIEVEGSRISDLKEREVRND